jgi:hypothetical protein
VRLCLEKWSSGKQHQKSKLITGPTRRSTEISRKALRRPASRSLVFVCRRFDRKTENGNEGKKEKEKNDGKSEKCVLVDHTRGTVPDVHSLMNARRNQCK